MENYIDIKELSNLIHISISTINKMIKNKEIDSYKLSNRRLFNKEEILVWMQKKKE